MCFTGAALALPVQAIVVQFLVPRHNLVIERCQCFCFGFRQGPIADSAVWLEMLQSVQSEKGLCGGWILTTGCGVSDGQESLYILGQLGLILEVPAEPYEKRWIEVGRNAAVAVGSYPKAFENYTAVCVQEEQWCIASGCNLVRDRPDISGCLF